MTLPDAAATYWRRQQNLNATTVAVVSRRWQMSNGNPDRWYSSLDYVVSTISRAQAQAALLAGGYIADALSEIGVRTEPIAPIDPSPLVGVTGAGLPLKPLYAALPNLVNPEVGMAAVTRQFERSVQTALSDAGRAAESLHITVRPRVGYVRMLVPPSCSRCVIQAGKYFKWNTGFKRHPRCDCRHVPASESTAGDLRVNASKYFQSLSVDRQDQAFGKAGAQAIRDGASITQVVNADQGLRVAQVYGRNLRITDQGVTKRGYAGRVLKARGRNAATTPRLMPESIYQIAEDRDDAIRLLRLNGYIKSGIDDIASMLT